jgi:hypothetical protein
MRCCGPGRHIKLALPSSPESLSHHPHSAASNSLAKVALLLSFDISRSIDCLPSFTHSTLAVKMKFQVLAFAASVAAAPWAGESHEYKPAPTGYVAAPPPVSPRGYVDA